MPDFLFQPWPWYIAGPVIGLFPALLLIAGNRLFGVSSNLRHLCAAVSSRGGPYFRYDWRAERWNLAFAAGILAGGFIGGSLLRNPEPVAIADATRQSLAALGVTGFDGMMPSEWFRWESLLSVRGALLIIGGGFLVGFGTAYAGGCTSGHGLSGIADLQLPSLIALVAFFAGGIIGTFVLLPVILR
ncbi:MAG: YeeE/YedE family protein [Acidobacteria bacterium]|nr:YeeE/YedE family protein [Acidobacteriota bacterium]